MEDLAETPRHADGSAVRREGSAKREAAHTPGPWEAWQERAPYGAWFVTMPGSGELAVGFRPNGEPDKANACLIAAAPDMLSALKAMVAVAENQGARWREKLPDGNSPLGLAQAAISKATGSVERSPVMSQPSNEEVIVP